MRNKLLILPVLALLAVAVMLAACTGGGAAGTITESGSTTVQPLAEKLAAGFKTQNPDATVTIQGGGSSVGIQSAINGTVDIGASSRELTAEEKTSLVEHLLARDGIAVVVHPSSAIIGLTKSQVSDIFSGVVTNWSQVGGPDRQIHVISREEGSGTRSAFEELVMNSGAVITSSAILQSSNGAIRTAVTGDPDSIGYLSFGYLDSSTKAVSLDGVAATEENARNDTYPAVRPLLFVTREQPIGLVKEFIDYCLGPDGQQIVSQEGYITAQ